MVHEEVVLSDRPASGWRDSATWQLGQDIAKGDGVDVLRMESRLMPPRRLGI